MIKVKSNKLLHGNPQEARLVASGANHMTKAKKTLDACNALAYEFHKDIDRILDFATLISEVIPLHYGLKSLKPPSDYTKNDAADLIRIVESLSDLTKSEGDGSSKKKEMAVTEQSIKSFRSIIKAFERSEMPSMTNEMALVHMQSTLEAFLKAYLNEAPSMTSNTFSGTSFGSVIAHLKKIMAVDLEKYFSLWPELNKALSYRNVYVHNHGRPDDRFRKQVKSFDLFEGRLKCSLDFIKRTAECAHALIDFIQFNLGRFYLFQNISPMQIASISIIDPRSWKGITYMEETIGKTMIVQVTFCNNSGEEMEQFLTYGRITAVAGDRTLTLTKPNKEPFAIPFDPKSIKLAPPGIYTDSIFGSTIINPELLTVWRARSPDNSPAKLDECKRNGFPGSIKS